MGTDYEVFEYYLCFYFHNITCWMRLGAVLQGFKNESANGVWVGFSTNNQAVSSGIVSVYYDNKYVTLNTADQKLYSGSYTVAVDNITSQDSKSF